MLPKNPPKPIIDVRPPLTKKPNHFPPPEQKNSEPKTGFRFKFYLKIGGLTAAVLLIINIALAGHQARLSLQIIKTEILTLKTAVPNFQTNEISSSLAAINKAIKEAIKGGNRSGLLYFSSFFGPVPQAVENTNFLSEVAVNLSKDLDYLQKHGVELFTNGKGNELLAILERIKNNLTLAGKTNQELKIQSFQLGSIANEFASFYAPIQFNLYRAKEFTEAILELLKKPEEQHLLLIFQNPSEMRPAGGFIGSFGDLTFRQGNFQELKIDDIYNADRQLNLNLIPPRELQNITKKWGARDANWFFDFPSSAKKVIAFLENSELYSKRAVQFSGALAINTDVLQSILEIVGPIELPAYQQTIGPKNFLAILQYEVEAGRDKKPGENPKRILSALAPLLLEKISSLSETQKNALAAKIKEHAAQKDLMIYFKDWKLQNVLEQINLAGDIFALPKTFNGDYLAVVNSNIGGGKSDAFVNEHLALKSQITPAGKILNELLITRVHNGEKEKDWWYRATNKNYLKILVPEKTKLTFLNNNDPFPEPKKWDYSGEYEYDADLAFIEKTALFNKQFQSWIGQESGKTFFGSWFNVPAGKTKTLKIIYENEKPLAIQDGFRYEFVFEKQSGVDNSLEYSIRAPAGYLWKESGKEVFEYGTQQPLSREIIKLTLVKKTITKTKKPKSPGRKGFLGE